MQQFTDGHLVLPLSHKSRMRDEYLRWRSAVLQERLLPEYKLKKLWKLGFSLRDIRHDRHYKVFPPQIPRSSRKPLAVVQGEGGAGKRLGARAIQLRYARALLGAAWGMLLYSRIMPDQVRAVRGDIERFRELIKKLGGKV